MSYGAFLAGTLKGLSDYTVNERDQQRKKEDEYLQGQKDYLDHLFKGVQSGDVDPRVYGQALQDSHTAAEALVNPGARKKGSAGFFGAHELPTLPFYNALASGQVQLPTRGGAAPAPPTIGGMSAPTGGAAPAGAPSGGPGGPQGPLTLPPPPGLGDSPVAPLGAPAAPPSPSGPADPTAQFIPSLKTLDPAAVPAGPIPAAAGYQAHPVHPTLPVSPSLAPPPGMEHVATSDLFITPAQKALAASHASTAAAIEQARQFGEYLTGPEHAALKKSNPTAAAEVERKLTGYAPTGAAAAQTQHGVSGSALAGRTDPSTGQPYTEIDGTPLSPGLSYDVTTNGVTGQTIIHVAKSPVVTGEAAKSVERARRLAAADGKTYDTLSPTGKSTYDTQARTDLLKADNELVVNALERNLGLKLGNQAKSNLLNGILNPVQQAARDRAYGALSASINGGGSQADVLNTLQALEATLQAKGGSTSGGKTLPPPPSLADAVSAATGKDASTIEAKQSAQTKTRADVATGVLPHVDDVANEAQQLDKLGLMGPIGARWREFLAGKIGAGELAGGNPDAARLIGRFRADAALLSSGVALAHSRSGGNAIQLNAMKDAIGADRFDLPTFLGATDAIKSWLKGYQNPRVPGSVGNDTPVTFPVNGVPHTFPSQTALDAFKKAAGIK